MTLETIAEIICKHTGVPLEKVRTKTRNQKVVYARHLICLLGKKYTTVTLSGIGVFLNPNKPLDHTTVSSAIKVLGKRMSVNEQPLCGDVEKLDSVIFRIIKDGPVKSHIAEVAKMLKQMPGYTIEPCHSFGELAKQLHKRIAS